MSATDGSELMEGKIIFVGADGIPSGREHYSIEYIKHRPELIEDEIKRLERRGLMLDDVDLRYLDKLLSIQ